MNQKSLEIMKKFLKPISKEQLDEVVRQLVKPGSFEQLTVADAGLEDEVRDILARWKERTQATE